MAFLYSFSSSYCIPLRIFQKDNIPTLCFH
ncbi:hypothetical protein F383_28567 [Gossypium arboreum]|uniref:Uncharacterized protein n=1 Tax=Gossypium arboreum TaxID=29729 RepID=A0A0B0PD32_GOSAR|nr:hypothetical protein F383_28567 [Gossypium arboreum]